MTNAERCGYASGAVLGGTDIGYAPGCLVLDCAVCRHNNHHRDPRFPTCIDSWLAAPSEQPMDIRLVSDRYDPSDPNPL